MRCLPRLELEWELEAVFVFFWKERLLPQT